MKGGKRIVIIYISVLFILFVAIAVIGNSDGIKTGSTKNYSMIVYGNDSARWENLYQGARLALQNQNAEVSLITMSANGDATEQIALIEREVVSGVDGILLAACDENEIGEYLKSKSWDIPVVLLENGGLGIDDIPLVRADDYDLGKTLGDEIAKRERSITKVAIIKDNTNLSGEEERWNGVYDAIEPFVGKVVEWKRNENEGQLSSQLFLQRELVSEAVDVVVALDNETSDALIDALNNLNKQVKVYCISTSDKSVFHLDQNKIIALEYQTEFAIGYEGANMLANYSVWKPKRDFKRIDHRIITKENMYTVENQKLVFPFVK